MFSGEFYKFSKNTFLYRTPLVAASELCNFFVENFVGMLRESIFETPQVPAFVSGVLLLFSRCSSQNFHRMSTEAATGSVLQEKVFLENSQNSQENTCARAFF